MIQIKSLLLLIFFIFFSKISLSEENKVVYVDLNMIMNNSIPGKSISSQLEANHKKNISNFEKIEKELKREEVEIISQKNAISKEEFEKKIMSLRDKANNFRKERNNNINDLNNQKLALTAKMITLIRPILSEYSDKNSISLIIDKKYRKERNDNINNLNNQRLNATEKMISLIRPILSEYSEKNSISLIIQKRNIVIGKTALDITDDILKIVDEKITKISLD